MKNVYIATFFLILLNSLTFNNVIAATLGKQDELKHHIIIRAADFLRVFTKEDEKYYKIQYRFLRENQINIRSGLNFSLDTSLKTGFDIDVSIGLDRVFRSYDKWSFYYGIDAIGGLEKLRSGDRWNYTAGLSPLIGIQFKIDNHFSISIEPALLFEMNYYKDYGTFNPNNSDLWYTINIINTGTIRLGFMF